MGVEPVQGCDAADGTAAEIRRAAAAIGYAACGFATAEPFAGLAAELERRAGLWPAVAALCRSLAARAEPRVAAPWARSIVVAVRRYGKYRLPGAALGHIGRNYLADRRVPGCPDHDGPARLTRALQALGLRVRRGGVPDRAAAARAGVVAIGRNGFAFLDGAGSWINIETWLVDADLPAGRPRPCPCPAGCRACLDACPTGAIAPAGGVRIDRCVAHLTYGAPEPIPEDLRARMGRWIYGCDACQEACPLNRGAWVEAEPAAWLDGAAPLLAPAPLAAMDLGTYRARIHPLFGYLPATAEGLARWRRNAARALAADAASAP